VQLSASSHFSNDLGLDSLDTVEVVMAIEEEFSIEIPDKEADAIHSVDKAVDYILSQPDGTLRFYNMLQDRSSNSERQPTDRVRLEKDDYWGFDLRRNRRRAYFVMLRLVKHHLLEFCACTKS
jgi:acyl carrier protein